MSRSELPALAAAAGWMEELKMPMREIREKYTRSELVIMAWRSSEMSYNMDLNSVSSATPAHEDSSIPNVYEIEKKLKPFENKLTGSDGEIDLRNLTSEEVMQYFNALGIEGRN